MTELAPRTGFDYLFKTIVIGDGAVGKTAITYRYATDKFQENYKMTIGVDFTIKQLVINDKRIKCQIWDTGGQERFSKIRPLYYRGSLGGLVVFDVTNWDTFINLNKWIGEALTNCKGIPLIIVGNKIDLENRVVTAKDAKSYAFSKSKEIGYKIPYLETSAKTGDSIKKVFDTLIKTMVLQAEGSMLEKEKKNK
ncbi:MAG: GTP-binding protein [Candidatus Heimdallarchaeota archaeon]|nr:GTP-binding protein [Candidatus Heimdallarchaeota archaeon]